MAKFERIEFKSHTEAAKYIVEELKTAGLEAGFTRWGSCPIVSVPSLNLNFTRPWAIEPYLPSWDVDNMQCTRLDEGGNRVLGLYPEEVVEKILEIRNAQV